VFAGVANGGRRQPWLEVACWVLVSRSWLCLFVELPLRVVLCECCFFSFLCAKKGKKKKVGSSFSFERGRREVWFLVVGGGSRRRQNKSCGDPDQRPNPTGSILEVL
jgi:hypothetical protein